MCVISCEVGGESQKETLKAQLLRLKEDNCVGRSEGIVWVLFGDHHVARSLARYVTNADDNGCSLCWCRRLAKKLSISRCHSHHCLRWSFVIVYVGVRKLKMRGVSELDEVRNM